MVGWLSNWREVWSCYRGRRPLPPLRFRAGFTLYHGPADDPIGLLHDVFASRAYRRYLPQALRGTMIDLGANIGAVALDWASRSPGLVVHAYEPDPRTVTLLRKNVADNELAARIYVCAEAVGRIPGTREFWTDVPSVLATAYGETSPASGGRRIRVQTTCLDEVFARAGGGAVTLLKIDTEGAEAEILEGASPDTLAAVEHVVLEYHDALCPGAGARCRIALERAGLRCFLRPSTESQGMLYALRG